VTLTLPTGTMRIAAVVALAVGLTPAAATAAATPAPAAAVTVRVLPATAPFSAPIDVLDSGVIVGNQGDGGGAGDDDATVFAGSRPWVALAGVTVPLGRAGAPYAQANAAAEPGIVAGAAADVAAPDVFTPRRALRWRGLRPETVPSPDVSASAAAVNRAGDVLVDRFFGTQVHLVAADGTTTEVAGAFGTYLSGVSLNSRREALLFGATGGMASTGALTVWRNGVATVLPGMADARSGARLCRGGITESGYVARSYLDLSHLRYQVVLRGRDDVDVALTDPATTDAEVACGAGGDAVNEAGHVIGIVRTRDAAGTTTTRATLWRDGSAVDLGVLPGDVSSRALAVNDRDEVLVQSVAPGGALRSFLWRGGTATELPAPAGYQRYAATHLNNRGFVAGFAVRTADGTPGGEVAGTRAVTWYVGG